MPARRSRPRCRAHLAGRGANRPTARPAHPQRRRDVRDHRAGRTETGNPDNEDDRATRLRTDCPIRTRLYDKRICRPIRIAPQNDCEELERERRRATRTRSPGTLGQDDASSAGSARSAPRRSTRDSVSPSHDGAAPQAASRAPATREEAECGRKAQLAEREERARHERRQGECPPPRRPEEA